MDKVWLTSKEAAAYTGVAVGTLYNRHTLGQPPKAQKIGNRLRYHVSELDRWITSNDNHPPPPAKRGRKPIY
ncbi:helix-turn-helix transcriptional regulator [Paramagnetospirillum caucaseum]|uniref:helix-turn-helix transcriptional regulator n=1 Tax=Paramagnetospirillum caucaseum TaxID=1244869 RepID=UPI0009D926ED